MKNRSGSTFEFDAGCWTVLDQKSTLNAWDQDQANRWEEVIDHAVSEKKFVVVLQMGKPGVLPFCSGGNLKGYAGQSRQKTLAAHRWMVQFFKRMSQKPILLQALMGGDAWGGGWELLSAMDIRDAWSEASLRFHQVRVGLPPGWGGGGRLQRQLPQRASGSILGGDTVSVRSLHQQGWIQRLTPSSVFASESQCRNYLNVRWQHLIGWSHSHWVRVLQSARNSKVTLEKQAFEMAWGQGLHADVLKHWREKK